MTAQPETPTMLDLVASKITDQVNEANALVDRINANTTDQGKLAHDILNDESATDEKVKAYQEWSAQREAELEESRKAAIAYVTANLLPATEDVDVDALKAEHKTLKDQVKAGLTFVTSIPGYDVEAFKVPDLKNLRGGTSGGTGSGGKRPRLNRIWVDDVQIFKASKDKQGNDIEVATFTLAAAAITKASKAKVEVKDLQAAAFAAAKTDDLSSLNGEVFDFYFESGEGENRVNAHVMVEPKNSGESSDETSEPNAEGDATDAE